MTIASLSPTPELGSLAEQRVSTPIRILSASREISLLSRASTVAEALAEAGIALGDSDTITPELTTTLTGVPLSIRIGRAMPTAIFEGEAEITRSDAAPGTPVEILQRLGIPLGPSDLVTSSISTLFTETGLIGQRLQIERREATSTEVIPSGVERRNDSTLAVGSESVLRPGVAGAKRLTYRYQGRERLVISEEVISPAIPAIIRLGTKRAASANPVVTLAGDDAWARLRQCEAGGNYARNSGNGYYGAYQYDLSTWNGYGGYRYASDAPPELQDQKARETQGRRGWSPWPACSRKLGLR